MSIKGVQILEGCTASFSGGSAKTFSETGLKLRDGGVQVADASIASVTTRPTATFNSTPEVYNSSKGSWTPASREVVSTRPRVNADGSQSFPSIRSKATNLHPEMTQAEILALRVQHAQFILDPELDAFWNTGTLS